mmetsp:Transcript_13369/g.37319  ORF Transcript_13369/g.37319 Transcript_13369/m.37319 type:complete len:213 (+) Transcript_13369:746-1384(+)
MGARGHHEQREVHHPPHGRDVGGHDRLHLGPAPGLLCPDPSRGALLLARPARREQRQRGPGRELGLAEFGRLVGLVHPRMGLLQQGSGLHPQGRAAIPGQSREQLAGRLLGGPQPGGERVETLAHRPAGPRLVAHGPPRQRPDRPGSRSHGRGCNPHRCSEHAGGRRCRGRPYLLAAPLQVFGLLAAAGHGPPDDGNPGPDAPWLGQAEPRE